MPRPSKPHMGTGWLAACWHLGWEAIEAAGDCSDVGGAFIAPSQIRLHTRSHPPPTAGAKSGANPLLESLSPPPTPLLPVSRIHDVCACKSSDIEQPCNVLNPM